MQPEPVRLDLARLTRERGLDVALVQLGATLAATSPPTRIAEEYAVLDCLSDGRLIAGVPVGIGADAAMSYGVPPIVQRARWREGIELMLRAWTDPDVFAWNGEHYQLRSVNLWPRPVQTPHPPLLVPGAHSASTWDMCHERDWPYAFLSFFGASTPSRRWTASGPVLTPTAGTTTRTAPRSCSSSAWPTPTSRRRPSTARTSSTSTRSSCTSRRPYFTPPGYVEYAGQLGAFKAMLASPPPDLKALTARDMIDRGFAVVGSPATVRDRLEAIARRLGVGHLLAVIHLGSMPHELAEDNIRLMASDVLPHLQTLWDAEGWESKWWPPDGFAVRRRCVAERHNARAGGGMTVRVETVPVRHCDFEAKVRVAGDGPPLVYLHPAGGPGWDPFLDALAERHTVYAPDHPGTGETARDAIHRVPRPVGPRPHLRRAARRPRARQRAARGGVVRRHGGLRGRRAPAHRDLAPRPARPDRPVARRRAGRPVHDDDAGRAPRRAVPRPGGPCRAGGARDARLGGRARGRDGRRGLGDGRDRQVRVADPGQGARPAAAPHFSRTALVVWGEHDRLVSPVYAEEFAARLAGARVEIVPDAGHVPQVERLDVVAPLVLDFLAA